MAETPYLKVTHEFTYSIGSIDELRSGTQHRHTLPKNRLEIHLPLHPITPRSSYQLIIVPQYFGIYQTDKSADPKKTEEDDEFNEIMLRVTDLEIKREFGLIDETHPDLIMLGYNPNHVTQTLVEEVLNDPFKRVAVHPVQTMPHAYEKNTEPMMALMARLVSVDGYKCPQYKPTIDDFRRVEQASQAIHEQTQHAHKTLTPYGLTRNEWYNFYDLYPKTHKPPV